MIKKCAGISISLIFLSLAAMSPPGCAAIQGKGKIIKDIIYTHEVPAAFETLLICKVDERVGSSLRYKWFSGNGTIKSNGTSAIWVAPSVPGTYSVGVNVIDGNGWDDRGEVRVQVVPFDKSFIDISPEIAFEVPVWGNGSTDEVHVMSPIMTAEIKYIAPLGMIKKYKFAWSCNGGKMQGDGIKEGNASKIGWVSPGVPGPYTVAATISDEWGNIFIGCVYFNVVNPACCGGNGTCGVK